MAAKSDSQINDWLKKLERESWQLELLVSAFTIFLLIGASSEFDDFVNDLHYSYDFSGGLSVIVLFFLLLGQSIKALIVFLVGHLLLRGFWIGTIGLRSVQNEVDFESLRYSERFTEKLKKRVITLDRLAIRLDEICSVVFSFAFLVIFMLLALGLWMVLLGAVGFVVSSVINLTPDGMGQMIVSVIGAILFFVLTLSGIIYLIDFLTLGFFKKFKWFTKIYYPFYWFYSYVTLAFLSRSIYYYMISKFSKNRIRWVFGVSLMVLLSNAIWDYDHTPYFPVKDASNVMHYKFYDDQRSPSDFIGKASIASSMVQQPFFQVFLRYDPMDNLILKSNCPDYEPARQVGFNSSLQVITDKGNFHITGIEEQESGEMLECLSSIYQLSVNDSVYEELKYHFYLHPSQDQKGLLTTFPTSNFKLGENVLTIKKVHVKDSLSSFEPILSIPFWYHPAN